MELHLLVYGMNLVQSAQVYMETVTKSTCMKFASIVLHACLYLSQLSSIQFTAILCPSLSPPVNGFIEFTESAADLFNFRTAATYVCNAGFGLSSGDRVRTCIGSPGGPGEWSGTAPICEG